MRKILKEALQAKTKKAMPILFYPAKQLIAKSVKELILSPIYQAEAMRLVSERVDSMASIAPMDLSLEAEAFGLKIEFSADRAPRAIGQLINSKEDAKALKIPTPTRGRIGLCINAIERAAKLIEHKPIIANLSGPLSVAGQLIDLRKILQTGQRDTLCATLEKVTEFLINCATRYKDSGASALIMAEPFAGIFSPEINAKFSVPYARRITESVRDKNFAVIYHNCGNNTVAQIADILKINADAYHFGNAIDIVEILNVVGADTIVMGNLDPLEIFCNKSPESSYSETLDLLKRTAKYPNFIISSGCDIPAQAKWENIDAFFSCVAKFYKQ